MKKKKLRFDALTHDTSLEVINKEELLRSLTGGSSSWDCVFKVFDHLDGDVYDTSWYHEYYVAYYGVNPEGSGGISTSHISTVGAFGDMSVTDITQQPSTQIIPYTGSGSGAGTQPATTSDGRRLMMTFAGADGKDHAVVVTGGYTISSGTYIVYYDPTTGNSNSILSDQKTGLYAVGAVGSYGSGS